MENKDFFAFFDKSEKIITDFNRKEFAQIVNYFKGQGASTPASILATIGWYWFSDQEGLKKDFSHIFVYDGEPLLTILGDANGQAPLGFKVDFDLFEKIGYSKRDMLDVGKLFEATKYAVENKIDL